MGTGQQNRIIVLVERDRETCAAIRESLASLGARVITHEHGPALLAAGVPAEAACLMLRLDEDDSEDVLSLIERLRRSGVRQPLLMLSHDGDVRRAAQAMRAGACDVIAVPSSPDRLRASFAYAASTGGLPGTEPPAAAVRERLAALSPRERDVLIGLARGKPNKAMSAELGISVRTVETHRARMMARLGVRSLGEAVRMAVAGGLLD